MQNWESVVELAAVILGIIAASGGTTALVDWLKAALNLEGTWALVLTWVVGGVVALVGGVAAGTISPEIFGDPIAAIAIILSVLFGADKIYQTKKRNA